jgi:hypothetical protein
MDYFYYIFRSYEDKVTIVEARPYELYEYDEDRFLTDSDTGYEIYFSTREEAVEFINKNFKPMFIDPDCRGKEFFWNEVRLD